MPKIPEISSSRVIRAFRKKGFEIIKEGKNTSMFDGERIIVIPHSNQINAYTMGGIIKDAGITIEEFKSLL